MNVIKLALFIMRYFCQHRLTMPSRCGTAGQSKRCACLGLPGVLTLEQEQGNHTCDTKRRRSKCLGVVSAEPLYDRWCRLFN